MYPTEECMLACSSFLVYLFIYLVEFLINQSIVQSMLIVFQSTDALCQAVICKGSVQRSNLVWKLSIINNWNVNVEHAGQNTSIHAWFKFRTLSIFAGEMQWKKTNRTFEYISWPIRIVQDIEEHNVLQDRYKCSLSPKFKISLIIHFYLLRIYPRRILG